MIHRQIKSVRLDGDDVNAKREELRSYFHQSYDTFESLFGLLASDEVFYLQSEPTRHPMIFYFGHTAVFYVNKLVMCGVLKERINPAFESLFAVGVDEMVWDESSERFAWPAVSEVRAYRAQVRDLVDYLILTLPMTLPVTQDDPFWAIWMGIEHERIHIETSSVLHRQMALEHILPHADFPRCPESGEAPRNDLVPIVGGTLTLGKGSDDQGLYGWDNEYGARTYTVDDFEASKYLVSNGEFLPFVLEGGYDDLRWWDEEGRKFLTIRGAVCPPFWIARGEGEYRFRALCEEMELPMDWPVEVNALEAQAFCRWKSAREGAECRLPSEAEWYRMVGVCGMESAVYDDARANINLAHYASSSSVGAFVHGPLCDVVGNVWQWTQTPIEGFEGFATHPWYDDFSTPTFDGKHNLMKGGSWISTGNEIVSSSRYAFRRHFYQHAGFRYVRGGYTESQSGGRCIEDPEIAALCKQGYGGQNTFGPEAASAIAATVGGGGEVLELGCKAGRLSLELSVFFDRVIGIDRSARFIVPAVELLREGSFCFYQEGQRHAIELEPLGLPRAREGVAFYQGDIRNLKPHLSGYDCIVINGIYEETEDFERIVDAMKGRLKPGGALVVLASEALRDDSVSFGYLDEGRLVRGFVNVWR